MPGVTFFCVFVRPETNRQGGANHPWVGRGLKTTIFQYFKNCTKHGESNQSERIISPSRNMLKMVSRTSPPCITNLNSKLNCLFSGNRSNICDKYGAGFYFCFCFCFCFLLFCFVYLCFLFLFLFVFLFVIFCCFVCGGEGVCMCVELTLVQR